MTLERWEDAASAMSRAHAISVMHLGEKHSESRRRAEVLRSLRQQLPAAPPAAADQLEF